MFNKKEIFRALDAPFNPLLAQELSDFPAQKNSAWCQEQTALLRAQAEKQLAAPAPVLSYSLFRLYWENGDRAQYETAYFERRSRLLCFSLLAWLDIENEKWLRALEDILWDICAEPFWCMPAHFMAEGDAPLPFSAYATQLDLFSCETAFALAECLALHENRLAPDVISQIDAQLELRVFTPFSNGDTLYRFEAMTNNWSSVCGGAIGGAALYRLQDKARLASVLHRCLSCMEVYLSSFGEDGVCVEGVGYWAYGFGFYTCFADLLEKRTQGALNLFNHQKIQAIAKGQQYFYLAGENTVSFADGGAKAGFRMGISCYLQKRFPATALPNARYADDVLADHCNRFCLALRDFLWYSSSETIFGLPDENSTWLPDAQWFLSRANRLAFAAKAGNNGESHNHNDCGSFILCKDGAPLLCDLGAGLYTGASFGPHRYDIFINASRSHSVPLFGGIEQRAGADAASRDVEVKQGEWASLSMDLSACYPLPALTRLKRVFIHQKAENRLSLTDDFSFDTPMNITEVFVSREPIVLADSHAVFAHAGVQLCLQYDETLFIASLCEEQYPDHDGIIQTAYMLHLTSRTPDNTVHFCASFE